MKQKSTIKVKKYDDADSDMEFELFQAEKNYISPEEVEAAVTDRIQQLSLRLATVEITYQP